MSGAGFNPVTRGSWTPRLLDQAAGEATYTIQQGTWTKIGNVVHVGFSLQIATVGTLAAVSPLRLLGLPFSVGTLGAYRGHLGLTDFSNFNLPTVACHPFLRAANGQAYADLKYSGNNIAIVQPIVLADITGTLSIAASGFYLTN